MLLRRLNTKAKQQLCPTQTTYETASGNIGEGIFSITVSAAKSGYGTKAKTSFFYKAFEHFARAFKKDP